MGFWKNLFKESPKNEWIPVAKCIMDGYYTDNSATWNIMFIFLEKPVTKERKVKIIHSEDDPSMKYTGTMRADSSRGRFQFNWYEWENHGGPLPKQIVAPGGAQGRAQIVPMDAEHVPVKPPENRKSVPAKPVAPKVKTDDANNIITVDFNGKPNA